MKSKIDRDTKALVTVLEDIETAHAVVEALHKDGFSLDKIELVTHAVHDEAPEIETPYTSSSTTGAMLESGKQGAGMGIALGLVAAVFAPFPGVGIAMIAVGGMIGGAIGSIAGIEHATEDNAIDLPSIDEYEHLVQRGCCLVVVLDVHDELVRAAEIIEGIADIHSHIHRLRGHDLHEHPTRTV